MHGLAVFQPADLLERKDFWATAAYNIGGTTFTLDDIEHGILRGVYMAMVWQAGISALVVDEWVHTRRALCTV